MAKRALRVANCSGAVNDPGDHMYNQAKYGPVDVITGDYLAEMNLASYADAYNKGEHPGWLPTAWDGIQKTIELADEKRIKIIINGGCLNPRGLAEKTFALVTEKKLNLKVGYVEGDNLLPRVHELIANVEQVPHLDGSNPDIHIVKEMTSFLDDPEQMPIVSANAYLGIRAIKRGLEQGADIIICGRVSDASPVIAAAAWWHGWSDTAYDELAGALIAGHLIECSTYITGGNFAGFFKYDIKDLLDIGLPIVEIEANGDSTVTKHPSLNGFVTADTVKCQLLYELQGNIYLNSDVKADITNVCVVDTSTKDRVHVSGTKGYPPPLTTKFAVFYKGGFQAQILINASGYATSKKFDLQEAQLRTKLQEWNILDDFDVLDFQRVGVPEKNPQSQLASTTYLRIFAQAKEAVTVEQLFKAWEYNAMAHFAGMHCSLDFRTAMPLPFLGYYPAIIKQSELEESVSIIDQSTGKVQRTIVGPPLKTEPLQQRDNYEPTNSVDLASFGPTVDAPLGDIALARSGDKGSNVNLGIFVHTPEQWDWLRSFLTRTKMRKLMGSDWEDWFFIERVEFPELKAVHFVIYGPLGRGVSSSKRLDLLGKGFGEFIRDVYVPIPKKFVEATENETS